MRVACFSTHLFSERHSQASQRSSVNHINYHLTADLSTLPQGTLSSGETVTKTPMSRFSPRSHWYVLGLSNMKQVFSDPLWDPALEDWHSQPTENRPSSSNLHFSVVFISHSNMKSQITLQSTYRSLEEQTLQCFQESIPKQKQCFSLLLSLLIPEINRPRVKGVEVEKWDLEKSSWSHIYIYI